MKCVCVVPDFSHYPICAVQLVPVIGTWSKIYCAELSAIKWLIVIQSQFCTRPKSHIYFNKHFSEKLNKIYCLLNLSFFASSALYSSFLHNYQQQMLYGYKTRGQGRVRAGSGPGQDPSGGGRRPWQYHRLCPGLPRLWHPNLHSQ